MTKKWAVVLQLFLVLTALAGSLFVAFTPADSLLHWYQTDDAFFYYKVANNVWDGHGFTFDGINRSNGFHPLWMIVCLTVFWLSKINLILPLRALVIVSGMFNAATAIILYQLLKKYIHPLAAITGAFFWALLPSVYTVTTVNGMESAVSTFFIMLFLSSATSILDTSSEGQSLPKRMISLGVIGAFTILARLDNIFIVGLVGLFLLFKVRKISYDLVFDVIAIGFSIILSWLFRLGITDLRINMYSIYPMIGIAIVFKPIVYFFCGMYAGFKQRKWYSQILREAAAAFINALLMLGILAGLKHFGFLKLYSLSVIALDAVISTALIFCLRLSWKSHQENSPSSPFKVFIQWVKKVWKEVLLNGVSYAFPIAVILGIYFIINKAYFGTFMPVSGQVKTWWSSLPNTVYSQQNSILSLLGLESSGNNSPWVLLTSKIHPIAQKLAALSGSTLASLDTFIFLTLFVVFLMILFALLRMNNNRLAKKMFSLLIPAVFLACLFQIAYINSVGYTGARSWYWIGEMVVLMLLFDLILDQIFVSLGTVKGTKIWSPVLTVTLVLVVMFFHGKYILTTYPSSVSKAQEHAYLNEVKTIESLTEPGAYIGMTGGGAVAYFINNRQIVNLDGLISSVEYFSAMKNGTAKTFLDSIPLSYVYGNEYVILDSDPYKEILSGRLVEIGFIRGFENFTLYRYAINQ